MEQKARKYKTTLALVGFLTGFGTVFGLGFFTYGMSFLGNGEALAVSCFLGVIVGFFLACFLSGSGGRSKAVADGGEPGNISWDRSYASYNDWIANGCKPRDLPD